MEERRKSQRLRTLRGGSILIGKLAPIECIIRNMSGEGANLEVSPRLIPDAFTLLIKREMLKRPCVVVWRSGRRVGVRFV